MYELRQTGVGREQKNNVVQRNGTDEIEKEPTLEIVLGDFARFEDDFVGEVVRNDTCKPEGNTATCTLDVNNIINTTFLNFLRIFAIILEKCALENLVQASE